MTKGMHSWEDRIELSVAYRAAALAGFHEGICNHFSVMASDHPDQMLIIPYGMHWTEVTASGLIAVDREGRTIEGEGNIEITAFRLHTMIHRMRPDARCVLHTHMPYATALTLIDGGKLLWVSQNSMRFYGRVAYAGEYDGLVLTESQAERIAKRFGRHDVLFHANHGVFVVAKTIAKAYDDLYYLERACMAQVLAQSTHQPLRTISTEVVETGARQFAEDAAGPVAHFSALKRLILNQPPDYRK